MSSKYQLCFIELSMKKSCCIIVKEKINPGEYHKQAMPKINDFTVYKKNLIIL